MATDKQDTSAQPTAFQIKLAEAFKRRMATGDPPGDSDDPFIAKNEELAFLEAFTEVLREDLGQRLHELADSPQSKLYLAQLKALDELEQRIVEAAQSGWSPATVQRWNEARENLEMLKDAFDDVVAANEAEEYQRLLEAQNRDPMAFLGKKGLELLQKLTDAGRMISQPELAEKPKSEWEAEAASAFTMRELEDGHGSHDLGDRLWVPHGKPVGSKTEVARWWRVQRQAIMWYSALREYTDAAQALEEQRLHDALVHCSRAAYYEGGGDLGKMLDMMSHGETFATPKPQPKSEDHASSVKGHLDDKVPKSAITAAVPKERRLHIFWKPGETWRSLFSRAKAGTVFTDCIRAYRAYLLKQIGMKKGITEKFVTAEIKRILEGPSPPISKKS